MTGTRGPAGHPLARAAPTSPGVGARAVGTLASHRDRRGAALRHARRRSRPTVQAVVSDALVAINGHVEGIDTPGRHRPGRVRVHRLVPDAAHRARPGRGNDPGRGGVRTSRGAAGRADRPTGPGRERAGARGRRGRGDGRRLRALPAGCRDRARPGGALRPGPRHGEPRLRRARRGLSPRSSCTPGASTPSASPPSVSPTSCVGSATSTHTFWVWLSPLGWLEKTAPFADDQRWWVLLDPHGRRDRAGRPRRRAGRAPGPRCRAVPSRTR